MGKRLTTEEWMKRAKAVHGDRYDYSGSVYDGCHNDIKIKCKKHGLFLQTPNNHGRRQGCPKCSGYKNTKYTTEEWTRKMSGVHEGKYSYDKALYIDSKTKVLIKCGSHGYFWQAPLNHGQGQGCSKCSNKHRHTTEEWVSKMIETHGNVYNYDKVKYINKKNKVIIGCAIHGDFQQTPDNHGQGQGCPKCRPSKGEKKIRSFLGGDFEYCEQATIEGLRDRLPLRFDFEIKINKQSFYIEFQGKQHYESIDFFGGEDQLKDQRFKDQLKRDFCQLNDIPFLEIRYDDEGWEGKIKGFLKNSIDK